MNGRSVTVVVADDQPMMRAGVALLLEAQPDINVVAEADDGAMALELAAAHRPDVLLMDVRMPILDGVEATRRLTADQALSEVTRVLVLTTFDEDDAVYGALRAGASGFLLKHAAPRDLVAAVRAVAVGEHWIDSKVAGRVIAALADLPGDGSPASVLLERLTAREREVLSMMARGLSNQQIASSLVLSEATVRTHVSRIMLKTGSHDRGNAIVLAYQSGLVVPGIARPEQRADDR